MAFLSKNTRFPSGSSTPHAVLDQYIRASVPAASLPATTTGQLFRVYGGRILVKALVGEVTTAFGVTLTNLKVSSKKLTDAGVAVGTAVDVAADVAVASRALGDHYFVEGDGTAGVLSTAGAVFIGPNSGWWIAPQGEIYLTTNATNTGAAKWDLYYQPLDAGAYVAPVPFSSGTVLQVAI